MWGATNVLLLPWQVIEDYFCSCTIGSPWVMPQIENIKLPVSSETTALKHYMQIKSGDWGENEDVLLKQRLKAYSTRIPTPGFILDEKVWDYLNEAII